MFVHIPADIAAAPPFQGFFQQLLPVDPGGHVPLGKQVRPLVLPAEIPLGVLHEGPCVYGVVHLLIRQFLPLGVYHSEPAQLFVVVPLAQVHHQGVGQYPLLPVRREVPPGLGVAVLLNGKGVFRHEPADAHRPLLPVQELVPLPALYPVHSVQRKASDHSLYHLYLLIRLVDKLPLELGAYVQQSPVPHDSAVLAAVFVPLYQVPHGDIQVFYFHFCLLFICFYKWKKIACRNLNQGSVRFLCENPRNFSIRPHSLGCFNLIKILL